MKIALRVKAKAMDGIQYILICVICLKDCFESVQSFSLFQNVDAKLHFALLNGESSRSMDSRDLKIGWRGCPIIEAEF